MPYGNITRHPSYNNRFRSSAGEVGSPVEKSDQLHSVSEMVSNSDTGPISPDSPVSPGSRFPDIPVSPGSRFLDSPVSSGPNSPDNINTVRAKVKRVRYMESRSMSHSAKPIIRSTDSGTDEVFLEMGDHDNITTPSDIIKMLEKRKVEATLSSSSTTIILPNPYNKINHRIHSFFWCTCCLYFVFICCLPGVHYMQESDVAFKQGDDKKAQRLGKMATMMFLAGALFSVACYGAILFVVIFFSAYW